MKAVIQKIWPLPILVVAGVALAADLPPPWAYGFTTPLPGSNRTETPVSAAAAAAAPASTTLLSVPGSARRFTLEQISDSFAPADWFPEDHPPMPQVVAHGRSPNVMACSLCHYPNGRGRPENASIAGLPVAYFMEQIRNFREGKRNSADPRKANTAMMVDVARNLTNEELKQAAEYFSSMKVPRWIEVVETSTVPKTRISGGMFIPTSAGREPIGARIIEVPKDPEAVEVLRNPRVGFIAYAPPGSLAKGEALVKTGGGKMPLPCTTCHGPDLRGMLNIPAIAGRSPSYMARQMFDMKSGARSGTGVDLMKPIVANLDTEEILAIVAYVASLEP